MSYKVTMYIQETNRIKLNTLISSRIQITASYFAIPIDAKSEHSGNFNYQISGLGLRVRGGLWSMVRGYVSVSKVLGPV